MFPSTRHRRLRRTAAIRNLVRQASLKPSDLIMPFFVTYGVRVRRPILSMPGQYQLSIDELMKEAGHARQAGILAALLFGVPQKKDSLGKQAYAADGIVQRAARALKKKFPELVVITDLCFCEYTDHGHCGVVKRAPKGSWDLDNDATLLLIRKTAVAQARAGADFIAPSGMTDGAVAAIRDALDKHGFKNRGILAYSAKFASVFYGPFRDAAGSTPRFGDRRSYQMDAANQREALREIQSDIEEGADLVMIKPALAYLDIIAKTREMTRVPIVAYNVSGEYAMVKAAENRGWLSGAGECRAAMEILLAMKRAGADLIITYHALEVARVLKGAVIPDKPAARRARSGIQNNA